jgi:hypothetical protein
LNFLLGSYLASHLVDLNIQRVNSDLNLVNLFHVYCPAADPFFLKSPELTFRKIKNSLVDLETLNANSYFTHPYFGDLNLKKTIWFLNLHTNHHLKIIKDIADNV